MSFIRQQVVSLHVPTSVVVICIIRVYPLLGLVSVIVFIYTIEDFSLMICRYFIFIYTGIRWYTYLECLNRSAPFSSMSPLVSYNKVHVFHVSISFDLIPQRLVPSQW